MGFDVAAYAPLAAEVGGDEELSPAEAREIRLEYADRLRDDVRTRSKVHAN
jgi:hypothetical protein